MHGAVLPQQKNVVTHFATGSTCHADDCGILRVAAVCDLIKTLMDRAVQDVGLIPRALHSRVVNGARASFILVGDIGICSKCNYFTGQSKAVLCLSLHVVEFANPSCLHTTMASIGPQPRLQIVPHSPFRHTSTLPSFPGPPFLAINLTPPFIVHSSP